MIKKLLQFIFFFFFIICCNDPSRKNNNSITNGLKKINISLDPILFDGQITSSDSKEIKKDSKHTYDLVYNQNVHNIKYLNLLNWHIRIDNNEIIFGAKEKEVSIAFIESYTFEQIKNLNSSDVVFTSSYLIKNKSLENLSNGIFIISTNEGFFALQFENKKEDSTYYFKYRRIYYDEVYQKEKLFIVKNFHVPNSINAQGKFDNSCHKLKFYDFERVIKGNKFDICLNNSFIFTNGGEAAINHFRAMIRVVEKKNLTLRTQNVKAVLLHEDFENVKKIPEEKNFKQDTKTQLATPVGKVGSEDGWYKYIFKEGIIALPKRTIVIKTHNNKYVKMKIEAYTKDNRKVECGADIRCGFNRWLPYYTFTYQFADENGNFN
jgi:hypothetical protein